MIFPKIDLKFYLVLQLVMKLMNMFSYFITIHFITSNKTYHFCHKFIFSVPNVSKFYFSFNIIFEIFWLVVMFTKYVAN